MNLPSSTSPATSRIMNAVDSAVLSFASVGEKPGISASVELSRRAAHIIDMSMVR